MEHKTNFSEISIIMATADKFPPWEPLFPEPPQVKADDIWPDYMIDWLNPEGK